MPVDQAYKKKVLDELVDPFNVPVDTTGLDLTAETPTSVATPLPIPKIPSTPIPSAAIPNRKADLQAKVEEAKMETASKPDEAIESQNKKDFTALSKDADPVQKKDLKWLEQQYEALNQEYKGRQKDAEWRAVAETISNSLTKLFAARAGMKAGVDMSGLQLDRTDFNKELEGVREDIARRRGQAENLFGQQEKQDAAEVAAADKKEAKELEKQRFEYQKLRDEKSQALAEKELADKAEQNRLSREGLEISRQSKLEAQNIKDEDKRKEREFSLRTPYGAANTVEDAKLLKAAHESKQNFDSKLQEMIDLRKEYGFEVANREAVARGEQLSKDLLLEYKNLVKLGVLSKSDERILNRVIPEDPLGFKIQGTGGDPILENMKKFKEDSNKDFATKVKTRTRENIDISETSLQPTKIEQQNIDAKRARLMELRAKKEGK